MLWQPRTSWESNDDDTHFSSYFVIESSNRVAVGNYSDGATQGRALVTRPVSRHGVLRLNVKIELDEVFDGVTWPEDIWVGVASGTFDLADSIQNHPNVSAVSSQRTATTGGQTIGPDPNAGFYGPGIFAPTDRQIEQGRFKANVELKIDVINGVVEMNGLELPIPSGSDVETLRVFCSIPFGADRVHVGTVTLQFPDTELNGYHGAEIPTVIFFNSQVRHESWEAFNAHAATLAEYAPVVHVLSFGKPANRRKFDAIAYPEGVGTAEEYSNASSAASAVSGFVLNGLCNIHCEYDARKPPAAMHARPCP